ncbi:hypothetical protein DMENIID0001_107810 [Sergentomyia squamirostris]
MPFVYFLKSYDADFQFRQKQMETNLLLQNIEHLRKQTERELIALRQTDAENNRIVSRLQALENFETKNQKVLKRILALDKYIIGMKRECNKLIERSQDAEDAGCSPYATSRL